MGSETYDNILILCPKHHKEFDLGNRQILTHNANWIAFMLNNKQYAIDLSRK